MILKETPRLLLRHFELKDAQELFLLDSDPEVLKYLHTPPVKSVEEVEKIIKRIQGDYIKDGTARLIAEEKESGAVTGWAGLKYIRTVINEMTNFHDVGYRFRREFWGKGYGTEAAVASLEYGFQDLDLTEIHGMADVNNIGSNKILTKIGMTNIGVFDYEGISHYHYRMNRP